MGHRISAMGDRSLLVHCEGNDDARAVASAISAMNETPDLPRDVVEEVVPAANSVLVVYAGPASAAGRSQAIARTIERATGSELEASREVTLETRYDGPDLRFVAQHAGLSKSAVIELHASTEYRVAFLGFVPGFAYLTGAPELLQVPRRADPRTSVPAGSVAVANDMTAVYPRASPGGWQLIGTTQTSLFDPNREPPSLLTVGTRVRFVPA